MVYREALEVFVHACFVYLFFKICIFVLISASIGPTKLPRPGARIMRNILPGATVQTGKEHFP